MYFQTETASFDIGFDCTWDCHLISLMYLRTLNFTSAIVALLLDLLVVHVLQYRPVRAGDTVYRALTRALRVLLVSICCVDRYKSSAECCL